MVNALKSLLLSGHWVRPSAVMREKEADAKSPKRPSLSKVGLAVMAMLFALGTVALGSALAGAKLMVQYQINAACCQISPLRSVLVYAKEKLGLATFYSQMGQDKWVSEVVYPG